jgi:hypothetical protein
MKVSFTGTRKGMTEWQKQQLRKWLLDHKEEISLFAHGCCCGADVEAHAIVREVLGKGTYVAVFPSTAKTRMPVPSDANSVAAPKAPYDRDRDIVKAGSDVLLAAPLDNPEKTLRSGTWATVRLAKKQGTEVVIFWRD